MGGDPAQVSRGGGGQRMSEGEVVSRQVTLALEHGLHLSPISQLVRAASGFSAAVTLSFDGRTADVKSVYDLMLLGAPHGAHLLLEARGADATQAVQALGQLFDGGFAMPAE